MPDTIIRAIRTNELLEFYEKEAWGDGVRPINALRAKAQAHNPHADPQDVVLLVAFEGARCVGYLGLVPALAQVGGGLSKVCWLSAWFVEPGARATSAGALLLLRAMRLDCDLLACGMSRDSLAALKAMRFSETKSLSFDRLVLDRRIAATTAPLRAVRRAIRLIGGNVDVAHRLVDTARAKLEFLKRPLWARMAAIVGGTPGRFIPVDRLRGSPTRGEERTAGSFYRGAETINWMLSFPWVPVDEDCSDRDYHFLSRRDHHRHLAFHSVGDDRAPGGHVTMLLSRQFGVTSLRLLDVPPDVSRVSDVAALVLSEGQRHNADLIELPTQVGEILAEVKGVASLMERVVLPCMYHLASRRSALYGIINDVQPRLTDGDLPFS